MSTTQFYGYRTPYDENQARERYLEYLKVANRVSSMKQSAERDAREGITPTKSTEKTTSEILADEAEMSRILQQRIAQLVQRADPRPKTVSETDDEYEQRSNPVGYVLPRLTQANSKLLITSFEPIKADLGGSAGNILPEDFLVYMNAFERAYRESGGVSKFNQSTRIIDELQGLRNVVAKQDDIENLRDLVSEFSQRISKESDISREQQRDILRSILTLEKSLMRLQSLTQQIDYDRIQEIVTQGTESVMQMTEYGIVKATEGQRDILESQFNAESIFKQLLDKMETLPTQDDLSALENAFDALLTSQTLDYEKADALIETANELTASITPARIQEIERLLNTIDEKSSRLLKIKEETIDPKSLKEIETRLRRSGNIPKRGALSEESKALIQEIAKQESQIPQAQEVREYGQPTIRQGFERSFGKLSSLKSPMVEEEEVEGKGMKQYAQMVRNKIQPKFSHMVGRGIAMPAKQMTHTEFGKYAISRPQLAKGFLTLRYLKHGQSVSSIPTTKISEDFADFLESFLETQHLDQKRLDKLPSIEKRLFAKIINGSGLYGKYKVRLIKSKEEEEEEKRFQLVKGIFIAGNDNPEVIKELKQFIIKFMADGRIPKREGTDLLLQLSL